MDIGAESVSGLLNSGIFQAVVGGKLTFVLGQRRGAGRAIA